MNARRSRINWLQDIASSRDSFCRTFLLSLIATIHQQQYRPHHTINSTVSLHHPRHTIQYCIPPSAASHNSTVTVLPPHPPSISLITQHYSIPPSAESHSSSILYTSHYRYNPWQIWCFFMTSYWQYHEKKIVEINAFWKGKKNWIF